MGKPQRIMDLNTALEGFWLDKEMNLADETIVRYGRVFDRFTDFIGDAQVQDITSRDIKRFLIHLGKNTNLGKRSIYDSYFVLSSFFSWCEVELDIEHVIRGKVDAPKYTQKKIQPVPMQDVQKIVKACSYSAEWKTTGSKSKRPTAKRDRAIVITLVDSGLRVSELCNLQMRDYESGRGRLHVRHGKGDKERFVFLGTRCRKAIWLYLASRHDSQPDDYLFCAKNGSQLERFAVRKMLYRAADRAGVKRYSPINFGIRLLLSFLGLGEIRLSLKRYSGMNVWTWFWSTPSLPKPT